MYPEQDPLDGTDRLMFYLHQLGLIDLDEMQAEEMKRTRAQIRRMAR